MHGGGHHAWGGMQGNMRGRHAGEACRHLRREGEALAHGLPIQAERDALHAPLQLQHAPHHVADLGRLAVRLGNPCCLDLAVHTGGHVVLGLGLRLSKIRVKVRGRIRVSEMVRKL